MRGGADGLILENAESGLVCSVASFQFSWPSFHQDEQSCLVGPCGRAADRSFLRGQV